MRSVSIKVSRGTRMHSVFTAGFRPPPIRPSTWQDWQSYRKFANALHPWLPVTAMAELDNALAMLAAWLERRGINYMVIGGFAVTVWGEPRFTRDLNVTVSVPDEGLSSGIDLFCSQFASLVADPHRFVAETR